MSKDLEAKVRDWIAADPDESTRHELRDLLERHEFDELTRRFETPLRFGTAGLRGPLRAGPAGMNQLSVRQVTRAVAAWLHSLGPQFAIRGVVVGRDARHGSEQFFAQTVSTLRQAGITVYAFEHALPTPLVSFAVLQLSAAAGIMITASHNPAIDNGYKLYDATGAQIIAPTDEIIEGLCATLDLNAPTLLESGPLEFLDDEFVSKYVTEIVRPYESAERSSLRIAYSAFHGVGAATTTRALKDAGFDDVTSLAAQNDPDGNFPTLAFPNPEEPEAMNLVIEMATKMSADLVLVNDPDADRLGVATIDRGRWRSLTGDEIGWLLADARLAQSVTSDDVFATTIVSSSLLSKMVERTAAKYVVTLTGFKWIARAGGSRALSFGYEEALGFAVNAQVADKDGVSAAVAFARRAQQLSETNCSIVDRLDELACTFGPHETHQISLRVQADDAAHHIEAALDHWRRTPPPRLGSLMVSEFIDLANGYGELAPTSGLLLRLGDAGRIVLRPSGTEAKLKVYLELCGSPVTRSELDGERATTRAKLVAVTADVTQRLRL